MSIACRPRRKFATSEKTLLSCIITVLAHAQVEKLSIIPRSGGALGFTYTPPRSEDKALMFDNEMRGQLAVLMGGRAAEALTCSFISTGDLSSWEQYCRAHTCSSTAAAPFQSSTSCFAAC